MAISDVEAVDAVGIEPETGNAMLVITDDLDWSDPVAHLNALQQKVTAYLGFIQSGQLEQSVPEAAGRKPKIGVIQQFEPPENILSVLAGLGEQLATMNIEFGFGPLPDGYEQPA
jgi:hypothetical protein